MSNVTRLPPHPKSAHVEADIPISQRDEFERTIVDIIAGERPPMNALDRDVEAITRRGLEALKVIDHGLEQIPMIDGAPCVRPPSPRSMTTGRDSGLS